MSILEERWPHLAKEDRWEDPRKRIRIVPMEVLALGFSRTGTSTMCTALEVLGYGPVCHGESIIFQTLDLEMMTEGVVAKFQPEVATCKPFSKKEFDQLLGQYRAITDLPASLFGSELMEAYPDAKVVLVEREIESWYKSFSETLATIPFQRKASDHLINFLDPLTGRRRRLGDSLFRVVFRANSRDEILKNARDVYREHYAEIRKSAKAGQLLEYKLGSGWEPLCAFLGKPIPNVPFPQSNDGAEFAVKLGLIRKRMAAGIKRRMRIRILVLFSITVALFWAMRS